MEITTNQAIQNLILAYLEDHPSFLETIKQKFALVAAETEIPIVDEDTERRIGEALAEYQAGKGIQVSSPQALQSYLDSLQEEHDLHSRIST